MMPRNVLRFGSAVVLVLLAVWVLGTSVNSGAELTGSSSGLSVLSPGGPKGPTDGAPAQPGAEVITHQPAKPAVVHLRDVPAGQLDPNNQLERWRRGEIELDEDEGIISKAEKALRQEAARALAPSANVQVAQSDLSAAAPDSRWRFHQPRLH